MRLGNLARRQFRAGRPEIEPPEAEVAVGPQRAHRERVDDRDRVTMLPDAVKPALARHLESVKRQHEADPAHGAGWVELPWALGRKYPNAGREWAWL